MIPLLRPASHVSFQCHRCDCFTFRIHASTNVDLFITSKQEGEEELRAREGARRVAGEGEGRGHKRGCPWARRRRVQCRCLRTSSIRHLRSVVVCSARLRRTAVKLVPVWSCRHGIFFVVPRHDEWFVVSK